MKAGPYGTPNKNYAPHLITTSVKLFKTHVPNNTGTPRPAFPIMPSTISIGKYAKPTCVDSTLPGDDGSPNTLLTNAASTKPYTPGK
jgi:hypothetical protein